MTTQTAVFALLIGALSVSIGAPDAAFADVDLGSTLHVIGPDELPGLQATGSGTSFVVSGKSGRERDGHAAQALEPNAYEYSRRKRTFCGTLDATSSGAPCVDDAPSGVWSRTCADGSPALDPLFRRPVDPVTGTGLGPWEATTDRGGCPEDAPVIDVVLSAEQFRQLPLAALVPAFQPADGMSLVNMDLIVFTEPTEQQFITTVLDTPVDVVATPVQYSWDFGNGTPPLVTTLAGRPWPNPDVAQAYTQPGQFPLTLTTTWAGRFRVIDTPEWRPVTGTATTTSPPTTITALEAHSRLIGGH